MDQVRCFYEKATEIRKSDVRDYAIAVRSAFHADAKGWKVYLKAMGVETAKKVTNRDDLRRLRNIGRRKK